MPPKVAAIVAALVAIAGGMRAGIIPSPFPPANTVPVNVTLPAISGTAQTGQVLSLGHGVWKNSVYHYTFQWQDCDSSGANCTPINGATGALYTVGSGDSGHTIRVVETAVNTAGTAAASSGQTAVVGGSGGLVPVNTIGPTISGTSQVERTLTASTGTWSNTPTSFSYQWTNCDVGSSTCTPVTGATASTYTVAAGQGGNTVKVQVTATNSSGSGAPATSAATSAVNGAGYGQCSPSPCQAGSWVRQNVSSFADTTVTTCSCTPNTLTGNNANPGAFEVYVPKNLTTNNASAKVPLVILADDGGFSGSLYEADWQSIANANHFIAIDLSPSYNATQEDAHCPNGGSTCGQTYAHPYALASTDQNACGTTFTSTCDASPYINGVLAWAESHYQIDSQLTYITGGSKGGTISEDMVCDTALNTTFVGIAAGSTHLDDSGTSVPPFSPRCAAMASGSSGTYHHISALWWWGDNDTAYFPGCSSCWTTGVNAPPWQYSEFQGLTAVGNAEGCATGGSSQPPAALGGSGTTAVTFSTYAACSYAQRLGLLEFGGSPCHAMSCNNVQGVVLAQTIWDFWTTGQP